MSEVTIIGLGAMGAALAGGLINGGRNVTVWNRTAAKAAPLAERGVHVASDPASAIAASDIVIICVDDYTITFDILSTPGCAEALYGKTVIQLSTGIPEDARKGEAFAHNVKAEYLDGAILAYPEHIGTEEAVIWISGPESTFRQTESVLKELAGGTAHVGEKIGTASALDSAALSAAIGAYLGALHGASTCETEGIPVSDYGGLLVDLLPILGDALTDLTGRISAGQFEDSHAKLQTYSKAAQRILRQANGSKIDASFPSYASDILGKGESAGLGKMDLAALITLLRRGA
jgi:3-hydroxyisobutyrate dehydrogenase-like beta-hydroxyacid dehydrogenase